MTQVATDAAAATEAAPPTGGDGPGRSWRRSAQRLATGYSFLGPSLALMGTFLFLPLAWAVLVSLQRTNGFGAGTFVGVDNYVRLANDPVFWRSLGNTVLFTVIIVPVAMALGLGLAVLMDSVLPARPVFRTIIILPMVISGVATGLMGTLVFNQNSGIVNRLLEDVGLSPVAWQSEGAPAFASVVLVTLWWRVGFNMVIYLAGLQSIDGDLYEAADIDGATGWQAFRHVTVPMVGPSTFFLLVMNVIYSFHVFDIVYVLTTGGPRNATSVLVTYAYETGFVTRDQGYAAAIGIVLLVVTLAFTAVQWRTSRTREVA